MSFEPKAKPEGDEGKDWVGKSPGELTARWEDIKVEQVLDIFDSDEDWGVN